MSIVDSCVACSMENTYFDGSMNVCPDCGHEWVDGDQDSSVSKISRDSNGTELLDGDSVTVIKDLKEIGRASCRERVCLYV